MSDLATIGDEVPLVHKYLKRKVNNRMSSRPAGSGAGDSEVELEGEGDASLAGDGVEPSSLEGRVVSMESKLDALTTSTSKLTDRSATPKPDPNLDPNLDPNPNPNPDPDPDPDPNPDPSPNPNPNPNLDPNLDPNPNPNPNPNPSPNPKQACSSGSCPRGPTPRSSPPP